MTTPTPSAPAPAPSNGSSGPHTATPSPKTDTASGPQTPSSPVRGPDGKFQGRQEEAPLTAAEKRRIKVKDLELDEDAAYSEIQRGRQSSKLLTEAQKRAEAADRKEREFREKLARVKTKGDLGELLKDLELTPEEERRLLAKHLYSRHIEPEQLSPEQRRIRELEEELTARQRQEQEAEAKQQSEAERAQQEEAFRAVEAELNEAIEAGKLPKSRAVVRRVAKWMGLAEQAGKGLPIEHAVQLAREDLAKETGELVAEANLEELRELWGEKAFNAFALKMVRHYMSTTGINAPSAQTSSPAPRTQAQPGTKKHRLTPQEFMRLQRKG